MELYGLPGGCFLAVMAHTGERKVLAQCHRTLLESGVHVGREALGEGCKAIVWLTDPDPDGQDWDCPGCGKQNRLQETPLP